MSSNFVSQIIVGNVAFCVSIQCRTNPVSVTRFNFAAAVYVWESDTEILTSRVGF